MARKAHDLFSLLQSRGGRGGRSGRRSGGGILGSIGSVLAGILPSGSRNRDVTRSRNRGMTLSGPTIAGLVFACLAVGYLLGDAFPWRGGGPQLNAAARTESQHGQVPGPLNNAGEMSAEEECRKLGSKALLVTWHDGEERAKASAISKYMRTQGIDARIYQFWSDKGQSRWFTLTYFGDQEQEQLLRQKLAATQFPPALVEIQQFKDAEFKNAKEGWPFVVVVE